MLDRHPSTTTEAAIGIAWAILTGEYPPQPGGVSDYTRLVAEQLARQGDAVHVFAPGTIAATDAIEAGTHVHRLSDHFRKQGIREVIAELAILPHPRRVLVQYVPHAFGSSAMNIRFCRWVRELARKGESVDVMFHEVAYPIEREQGLKLRLLALVNRRMAYWIAACAARIFVSIPAWEITLREVGVTRPVRCLPVPSNIIATQDARGVANLRQRFAGATLIGHFGTYGARIEGALRTTLTRLAERDSSRVFLLLGRGGAEFAEALQRDVPALAGRVEAPGQLEPDQVATYLMAMDVAVQPYPDGVSCRRSSVMAALALGVPVVTSHGHLTEPLWAQSGAVALAPTPAAEDVIAAAERLLADPAERAALGKRGLELYRDRFDLCRTIDALRTNL